MANEAFDVWVDLDGSNALVSRYVWGVDFDGLVARQNAGGAVAYYLADRQHSVRLVVDNAGTTQFSSTFDAFGNLTSGSLSDRFGYTGQEHDSQTGLISLGNSARELRPTTATLNQTDPGGFAASGPNLYTYVKNNATNATDPSGWEIIPIATDLDVGNQQQPVPNNGGRQSKLLVHKGSVDRIAEQLSAALGHKVTWVAGPAGSDYVYLVLPQEALNETGHEKLAGAVQRFGPVHNQGATILNALYVGSIHKPQGHGDVYTTLDPDTGKVHISNTPDFGATQVSKDVSIVSREKIDDLISTNDARRVKGYVHVTWIDPS